MSRKDNLYKENNDFKEVCGRRVFAHHDFHNRLFLEEQPSAKTTEENQWSDGPGGVFEFAARDWCRKQELNRGIHETAPEDSEGVYPCWYQGCGWMDIGATFAREVCKAFNLNLNERLVNKQEFVKKPK